MQEPMTIGYYPRVDFPTMEKIFQIFIISMDLEGHYG